MDIRKKDEGRDLAGGAEISVPSFVDIGTIVRVDTETGECMDRVKK